jgi:hypothetical protein
MMIHLDDCRVFSVWQNLDQNSTISVWREWIQRVQQVIRRDGSRPPSLSRAQSSPNLSRKYRSFPIRLIFSSHYLDDIWLNPHCPQFKEDLILSHEWRAMSVRSWESA